MPSSQRLWRKHGGSNWKHFAWHRGPAGDADLLELLDRLNPTIAELSQAIEQEAEKFPEARWLMTHPGVGALTALAFVLILGERIGFRVASRSRTISDWCPWKIPVGTGDG